MSSKLLFTVSALLSLSLALPTTSNNVARSPAYQECAAGTSYYSCTANGKDGCFDHDPCNDVTLPPPATASPPVTLPNPVAASKPQMYNLYFDQGAHQTDKVPHLDVRTKTAMQVVVFDDVPKGAKECNLRWRQPEDMSKRTLKTVGNGMVRTRQLTGFPLAGNQINVVTLSPFVGAGVWQSGLDFTNWAEVEKAQDHSGPTFDCSISPIAIELAGAKEGDNQVFVENNSEEGLYLQYKL